jgi:hypothetical protein
MCEITRGKGWAGEKLKMEIPDDNNTFLQIPTTSHWEFINTHLNIFPIIFII